MRTVTRHRTSVAWHLAEPLTASARETLAEVLDCVFTDENTPRLVMPIAHDVTLLVVPDATRFSVVAHFDEGDPGLPPTRVSWLTDWVRRACAQGGLPDPGDAQPVATGT